MALNLLSTSTDALSFYSPFIMILVMVLFMWLFIYRPQKKQQQKETEMRNSLEIGDEVTTIGGIVGRVGHLRSGDRQRPHQDPFPSCGNPVHREAEHGRRSDLFQISKHIKTPSA